MTRHVRVTRRWWLGAALLAIVVVLVILSLPITLEPRIKQRLMDAISERFESRVDVEALTVSVLPRVRVSGRGLVLHHKNRTDVPPLVTIAAFSAEASLFAVLRDPLRLHAVRLEGLEINVPPGGMNLPDSDEQKGREPRPSPLVIGELVSDGAVLRLLRSTPGSRPRLFEIRRLAMQDVGANHPWPFRTSLTNPTPPGQIQTEGTFGPWNASQPSQTPLAAEYRFENADLSVFKGIQGILVSTGRFGGILERIEVDGQATIPAFALATVGTPVHLETRFHSIVDGTSGDTRLQPVEARLIQSPLAASGDVVERDGQDGRTVSLSVMMTAARVEDILRLAVKGDPGMTGGLTVSTSFVLPPGDRDVIEKLQLEGSFAVATARFTTAAIQAKVDAFSTKARGVRDETPDPVVSNFRGRFAMKNGVIRFSSVAFSMPGTRVTLAGQYVMASEALDFRGTVHLDAKLSAMTTGMKSLLVRLVDGLFRHNDITVIPITVGGTASAPKVKLDIGRVFKRG